MHANGLKPLSPIFSKSLRVSVPLYSPRFAEGQSTSDYPHSASLFFARLATTCISSASSASLRPFFARLDTTCSSSESLPSFWSNTLALGSCLCDNKSKTRQRQAVVLSQKPPRKPCDLCGLRVSASLFRTFSHHVHKLRVSEPSLGSNTLALESCLCDNKSKTRQRQAVVLSQKPPRKPCDLCVLRVSASIFRTFEACWCTQRG